MATFNPNSIPGHAEVQGALANTLKSMPTGSNLEIGKDTRHLVRVKNMQGKRKYQSTVNGIDQSKSEHAADPAARTALDISAGIAHKNSLGGNKAYQNAGDVWGDPGASQ